ncbi:MAG TPA: HAMP domain-containing histidine kinase [Candidatus Scybalousia intestinigallinarum]|nr:HAMP domain-containing histidine kinase [Candidatus Scybalousia intestinigallinarum]
MFIVMIISLMINCILITAFFLTKKEEKRITQELKMRKFQESNIGIHQETSSRTMNELLLEINDLLKRINQQKIEVERQNKALKKMIVNISHDLRTPLTTSLGYLDILTSNDIDEKTKIEYLKIITERLTKLNTLLNSFFELAKVITEENHIDYEKINIISILENSIATFYEDFHQRKRKIDFQAKENIIYLNANKMMLTRVFDNLIINSLQHSKDTLEIEVKQEKEKIIITFTNPLLEVIDIDSIFDEFYTSDISRTKENTGLGLYIVKEYIEQLKGTVNAKKVKKEKNDYLVIQITLSTNSK